MDGEKTVGHCAFDILFSRHVPHILEKIFFSLDYESFQACFRVKSAWSELLSSQPYQKWFKRMIIKKTENEKKLWDLLDLHETSASEVKQLVSAEGWMNINSVAGLDQSTPLYQAAWHSRIDLVQVLLNGGAEPDKANKEGCTALLLSAQNGNKEMVQLLLDHGADPNKASPKGNTPLHVVAVPDPCTEVVKLLLDRGAQPKKENDFGSTPLHTAAKYGRKEMVQLLLERGADPKKKDEFRWTPLRYAATYGHTEVVELLHQYANPGHTYWLR